MKSYIIPHIRFYVNLHKILIMANFYLGLTISQHIPAIISKCFTYINSFISHKSSVRESLEKLYNLPLIIETFL